MPTIGCVEGRPTSRAVEGGVPEGEHPAVGGHQPVAEAVGVAAMPTTGSFEGHAARGAEEPGVP